jgi:hypothetical protein
MAKWENKIMLKEFIQSYERKEITIVDLCKKIAEYLRTFPVKPSEHKGDLETIADEFDVSETVEQFDDCLEMLYDFGDTEINGNFLHKVAWIETKF